MPSTKKALMREKNERSKTANSHRWHRLSIVRCGAQSEFTRHKNGLLGSGIGYFCLSDAGEDMWRWRLSRIFRFRGLQILRFASRNQQEVKTSRLASVTKALDSWTNLCMAQSLSPTQQGLRANCGFCWNFNQNFSYPHFTQTFVNTCSKNRCS